MKFLQEDFLAIKEVELFVDEPVEDFLDKFERALIVSDVIFLYILSIVEFTEKLLI